MQFCKIETNQFALRKIDFSRSKFNTILTHLPKCRVVRNDWSKSSVTHTFFKMPKKRSYVTPEIFYRGSQELEIPDRGFRE